MDNKRGDEPGRREEDRRWLKLQETVMNLVTSLRTYQGIVDGLEKDFSKLEDHVEDVDDHLRGVGGRESMDTRVTVMEKDVFQHGVLLREAAKLIGEIRTDLSTLKIHRSVAVDAEAGKTERLKVWLKMWGPAVMAAIALVMPLAKLVVEAWVQSRVPPPAVYRPDKRLRAQIEADKRGARGRAVKKKLEALEQAATNYHP